MGATFLALEMDAVRAIMAAAGGCFFGLGEHWMGRSSVASGDIGRREEQTSFSFLLFFLLRKRSISDLIRLLGGDVHT